MDWRYKSQSAYFGIRLSSYRISMRWYHFASKISEG